MYPALKRIKYSPQFCSQGPPSYRFTESGRSVVKRLILRRRLYPLSYLHRQIFMFARFALAQWLSFTRSVNKWPKISLICFEKLPASNIILKRWSSSLCKKDITSLFLLSSTKTSQSIFNFLHFSNSSAHSSFCLAEPSDPISAFSVFFFFFLLFDTSL